MKIARVELKNQQQEWIQTLFVVDLIEGGGIQESQTLWTPALPKFSQLDFRKPIFGSQKTQRVQIFR